ncbi:MAG: hypothetical protein ACQEQU_00785 [Spirochaetota bacterium]
MYKQNKPILIVCEGPSERAYMQELNRYFEEEDIPLILIAKPSNGGQYSLVIKKYKETRGANKNSIIHIWVDWDIYLRNDERNMDNYTRKPSGIPDFQFSYMNFEDFLSMHLSREELNWWWVSCTSRNHFTTPSHSNDYIPAFKECIDEEYTKGEIPIEINCQSLANMRRHQEDPSIPFKCDFAEVLFELIDEHYNK